MPRTAGSKNRQIDIIDLAIPEGASNEDVFLAELMRGKAKWARIAKELQQKHLQNEDEKSYAEAYRVLINRFTADQQENTQQ